MKCVERNETKINRTTAQTNLKISPYSVRDKIIGTSDGENKDE